ncbi:hypothetical protein KSX_78980 [Ktedonospora formicarum]|uniref:Uncharacterized protein n=1 Tax=Ktedonospora formicarum TaxID=2778364 RepID=A0A8J3MVW0_9CHLR|nr:hypothetical protein KSX_78980 [Ktedonospora formicarum]
MLYRSEKEGAHSNAVQSARPESIAILAFVPGGILSLFGRRFEAEAILAGFIGNEQARAYCQHVRVQT